MARFVKLAARAKRCQIMPAASEQLYSTTDSKAALDGQEPAMSIPPLYLLQFTFRFTQPVHTRFFHSPLITGLVKDRLGDVPDSGALLAVESGRVRYQTGDHYHFGLVLRGDLEPNFEVWCDALASPPQRLEDSWRKQVPLGDTYTLVAVRDLVADQELRRGQRPQALSLDHLLESVAPLSEHRSVHLRFVSPLLITYRSGGRTLIFDQEHADPKTVLERVRTRVNSWFPDVRVPEMTVADALVCSPPRELVLSENGLLRADTLYGKSGYQRGAVGHLVLEADEPFGEWALPLVLAGLVGIGNSTKMGLGRYTVVGLKPFASWPPSPACTLLQRATRGEHLQAAAEAMRDCGPSPGVDGVDQNTFLDSLPLTIGSVAAQLGQARFEPRHLRGLMVREPDDKLRPIAIPTMRDRFAQRCVLEAMRPAFEQLFEESSFAYRPGLSRRDAQRSVRKAYDDGYRWVLDADIASFFDEVEWSILEHRLRCLFGEDPVVDLLMSWVKAPIVFDGKVLKRTKGLPQGTVVSPTLANLYLDAFDESIGALGWRLVRYADDFLVLCKTRKEAEQALTVVAEALAEVDLELHRSKTQVTSFDHGFRFLGSIFCRSMVLDAPKKKLENTKTVIDNFEELLADGSLQVLLPGASGWLRELTPKGPQELSQRTWRRPTARPNPDRRPVYVVERSATLSGRRKGLWIEREGQPPALVGWRQIRAIAILGGHNVRGSVIQQALRNRVPVAFHRQDGQPTGLLLPDGVRSPPPRTMQQWAWMQASSEGALDAARALIEAKIHNQRLLVRRNSGESGSAMDDMARLGRRALRCESRERLRGLEGQAAHLYFSLWPSWVQPFAWPGRSGRGAEDAVNAMLNLLYSMLFRRVQLSILTVDLAPYHGLLHESGGRYAALAADLMEPFRFLVDRVVLTLIHRRQLRPADFIYQEKSTTFKMRIKDDAVRLLIDTWEKALLQQVSVDGESSSFSQHIDLQSMRLAELVEGERGTLTPFRMRW